MRVSYRIDSGYLLSARHSHAIFTLHIQRRSILITDVHFIIAIDLRKRTQDMPGQTGKGTQMTQ